jgi:hypothetical protein
MTRERHLTFSAHVAVEFLLGVALAVAPFVFDFDDGATIVSVAYGVATATAAISTGNVGHGIAFHLGWDRLLALLLLLTAVVSAIVDIGIDTAVFLAAALIEGVTLAITRYVPERA